MRVIFKDNVESGTSGPFKNRLIRRLVDHGGGVRHAPGSRSACRITTFRFSTIIFSAPAGWSRAQITLGFPLAALLTIWMGPLVVPRFSPRKMIVAGSGLTAMALAGFAQDGIEPVDLLRVVGRVHGRLHVFRTDSASVDRVALVPAEIAGRRWGSSMSDNGLMGSVGRCW